MTTALEIPFIQFLYCIVFILSNLGEAVPSKNGGCVKSAVRIANIPMLKDSLYID